ncbi:MAG: NAD(P)/FAD-dependent oxidoreductase [Halioglobus sp.]|nr:NAD(P)/FAD-dependent oxidoreductase [Halioglobus sp.]
MKWTASLQDITEDQLRHALEQAHVPALMAALIHLTSSGGHLRLDIRPHVEQLAEEEDGLTEGAREAARAIAMAELLSYKQAGCPQLSRPEEHLIEEAMHYVTGVHIPGVQMEHMREELNLFGEDRRRVAIAQDVVPHHYRVLVIGAGMSGILAAVRLQEAGIPFLVVDKNPEIGGTWYENTYPGCQVDSANHLYNYIFSPQHQWSGHYSGQAELFEYFKGVVNEYKLRKHMRLGIEVEQAVYNEDGKSWTVNFQDSEGVKSNESFDSVISACGQLNSPAMPDIPGVGSFAGIAFHSARWEHQHDLNGKRVAVIGTGCSATQFVPEIADQTSRLQVFQRSAPWLLPTEEYHIPMSEEELWCFRNIPFYARWYRFFLFRARASDGLLPYLYSEEGWDGQPESVSAGNAELRLAIEESIRAQAGDDIDLADALMPNYPPGGKRPVLDDGQWIRTLRKPHVTLVTEPIAAIEEEGIRTADGELHAVDVLIYGTGFKANQFLVPMRIVGRNGHELHDTWKDNPQAYLGMTVPGFPNFYCLYGPNTNIVVGSSIVFGSECEMRYIMGCLKLKFEQGIASLEVKEDRCREYNSEVDARNELRAWGSPHVDSWYKNADGRVSQNWPGTHWEWWQQTRTPDLNDFVMEK